MSHAQFPTRSKWIGKPFAPPAKRIVSLVPSLTQSLFMLGAGSLLVGRTQFCVKPAGEAWRVRAVGGTKNSDIAGILALSPDIVLASREENLKTCVLALAENFPVLLADPLDPEDAPGLWVELGRITGQAERARFFADEILSELASLRLEHLYKEEQGPRFVYFVWKNPWMAAGHDTFISRMLSAAGLRNALPPEDLRFPAVTEKKILSLAPDAYFYSTEPYAFKLPDDLLLPENASPTLIAPNDYRLPTGARALLIDAEPLSWYPAQTTAGLRYAAKLAKSVQS